MMMAVIIITAKAMQNVNSLLYLISAAISLIRFFILLLIDYGANIEQDPVESLMGGLPRIHGGLPYFSSVNQPTGEG